MPFLLKEEYVDCVAWFSGLLINGLTLYSVNQHFFWSIKFNGIPLTPTKLQQRIIHAINQTLRMEKKIATSLFSRRCKKPILTYSAFCIFFNLCIYCLALMLWNSSINITCNLCYYWQLSNLFLQAYKTKSVLLPWNSCFRSLLWQSSVLTH